MSVPVPEDPTFDEDASGVPRRRVWLPAALFVLTVASTVAVGGPLFSATLLLILVAHEMGHFFMAGHHRLPRSFPYFIPLPVSFIGTLGAVISMRTERATRNQIMDVGAAGPIAGFVFAVPAMIIGIKLSHPIQLDASNPGMMLGDSVLSFILAKLFGPELLPGQDLEAHPVMVAAWAGFLVTSLNLLPIGQLDGGHVLYALSPRRATRIARRVHRVLVALGLIGLLVHGPAILRESLGLSDHIPAELVEAMRPLYRWFTPGLLFMAWLWKRLGLEHPPVLRPDEPLTPVRSATAIVCFVIWILTFMPNPAWLS